MLIKASKNVLVTHHNAGVIEEEESGMKGVYHKNQKVRIIFPSLRYDSVFKETVGLS